MKYKLEILNMELALAGEKTLNVSFDLSKIGAYVRTCSILSVLTSQQNVM
jgi:hypothetical protein